LTPASADVAVLRTRLEAAVAAQIAGCHAVDVESTTPSLVVCALHKAAAISSEIRNLEALATSAREQLVANRDAAIEAVIAQFEAVLSALDAEVERKQAALSAEDAVCDVAVRDAQAIAIGVTEASCTVWCAGGRNSGSF
jgi:hypothetical protein